MNSSFSESILNSSKKKTILEIGYLAAGLGANAIFSSSAFANVLNTIGSVEEWGQYANSIQNLLNSTYYFISTASFYLYSLEYISDAFPWPTYNNQTFKGRHH